MGANEYSKDGEGVHRSRCNSGGSANRCGLWAGDDGLRGVCTSEEVPHPAEKATAGCTCLCGTGECWGHFSGGDRHFGLPRVRVLGPSRVARFVHPVGARQAFRQSTPRPPQSGQSSPHRSVPCPWQASQSVSSSSRKRDHTSSVGSAAISSYSHAPSRRQLPRPQSLVLRPPRCRGSLRR